MADLSGDGAVTKPGSPASARLVTLEASEVSVVIPTYGQAGRVLQALEALAAQTARPREVVVADDCSPDDTAGAVAGFAAAHPEMSIVYLGFERNVGMAENRNRGIRAASGKWIANCDDDDVWLPAKLERQIEFINRWQGTRRLAMVGAWGTNVNDRLEPMSEARMGTTDEAGYDRMMERGGVPFCIHSSVMFRRADFDAVGGYGTEYGTADEFPFFCRLADLGVVLNVPETLVLYRKRAGSMQLTGFMSHNVGLDHLVLNRRRLLDGLPVLDRESYAAHLASRPLAQRVRRRLHLVGMYQYRRGAVELANGRRVSGSLRLAAATVLDPRRVRAGVRAAWSTRRARAAGPS